MFTLMQADSWLHNFMCVFLRKMYIAEEQQKILELHHLGDVRILFLKLISNSKDL